MSARDSSLLDSPPQPLEEFAHESGSSDGIDFRSLDIGTVVNVHTRYSCYRLVVIDPEDKRALVKGGQFFVESTEVRIEGSTAGGTAIKRGWIGIGLRLEMLNLDKRITTSVVQSLTIDPPPISRVC
jgi:hypothetical protein